MMFSRIRKRRNKNPEPMNKIFISKRNIIYNLKTLQKLKPEHNIFPVLKSNAYGHGLQQMCKIFDKTKVKYLCVDSFPEYQIARDYSKKNILLIGETRYKNYKHFDPQRTTFCIYNIEAIHYLGKRDKNIKIHLFLNTGMNREGISRNELLNILETLKKYPKLEVEGILSHFYDADDGKSENYTKQIQRFKTMNYEIYNYGHSPKYKHISNSAGYLRNTDPFFNSARIGLALYGYSPIKDTTTLSKKAEEICTNLKPALTITSQIISKHTIGKNEGVSYNCTFINSEKELLIGTVPFGYMEGLPRSSSGKIYFYHKNENIKQIGTICMNLCSCILPHNAKCYDEIELISPDIKSKNNTLEKIAKKADMSIYEVLVHLDRNVRREIK